MEKAYGSRRRFLAALIAGVAGLFLGGRYLIPKSAKKRKTVHLAKAEVPEHGALVYREARLAVVREKGELFAIDLVCTHLGCTLAVTPDGLSCPCHGSSFDLRGKVLKGPADRPLKRYEVLVGDQGITVFL